MKRHKRNIKNAIGMYVFVIMVVFSATSVSLAMNEHKASNISESELTTTLSVFKNMSGPTK